MRAVGSGSIKAEAREASTEHSAVNLRHCLPWHSTPRCWVGSMGGETSYLYWIHQTNQSPDLRSSQAQLGSACADSRQFSYACPSKE